MHSWANPFAYQIESRYIATLKESQVAVVVTKLQSPIGAKYR
jgi:hypothetical protein